MNKLEIIYEINTLKRNKYKYQNTYYYYKLNSLYKKLSDANANIKTDYNSILEKIRTKYTDEEIIDSIMEKFNKKKAEYKKILKFYDDLLENYNIELLLKKYSLINLFLIENNLIEKNDNTQYKIQIKPIIVENNIDIDEFIEESQLILKLCEIAEEINNKVIVILILFDFLLKKFSYCLKNKTFETIIKNKILEFKLYTDMFNNIENKYNLEHDIITKLYDEINKLIVDK